MVTIGVSKVWGLLFGLLCWATVSQAQFSEIILDSATCFLPVLGEGKDSLLIRRTTFRIVRTPELLPGVLRPSLNTQKGKQTTLIYEDFRAGDTLFVQVTNSPNKALKEVSIQLNEETLLTQKKWPRLAYEFTVPINTNDPKLEIGIRRKCEILKKHYPDIQVHRRPFLRQDTFYVTQDSLFPSLIFMPLTDDDATAVALQPGNGNSLELVSSQQIAAGMDSSMHCIEASFIEQHPNLISSAGPPTLITQNFQLDTLYPISSTTKGRELQLTYSGFVTGDTIRVHIQNPDEKRIKLSSSVLGEDSIQLKKWPSLEFASVASSPTADWLTAKQEHLIGLGRDSLVLIGIDSLILAERDQLLLANSSPPDLDTLAFLALDRDSLTKLGVDPTILWQRDSLLAKGIQQLIDWHHQHPPPLLLKVKRKWEPLKQFYPDILVVRQSPHRLLELYTDTLMVNQGRPVMPLLGIDTSIIQVLMDSLNLPPRMNIEASNKTSVRFQLMAPDSVEGTLNAIAFWVGPNPKTIQRYADFSSRVPASYQWPEVVPPLAGVLLGSPERLPVPPDAQVRFGLYCRNKTQGYQLIRRWPNRNVEHQRGEPGFFRIRLDDQLKKSCLCKGEEGDAYYDLKLEFENEQQVDNAGILYQVAALYAYYRFGAPIPGPIVQIFTTKSLRP